MNYEDNVYVVWEMLVAYTLDRVNDESNIVPKMVASEKIEFQCFQAVPINMINHALNSFS